MLIKKANSQQGISSIELIPVLLVFALLINFSLGFFGVIHSGNLNSIAARNYAFETFRNRANLNRFRDDVGPNEENRGITYNKIGFRYHAIMAEGAPGDLNWYVTTRPIKFTDANQGVGDASLPQDHSQVVQITDPGKASDVYDEDEGLPSVWLKTSYGICLNSRCEQPPP